MRNRRTWSSSHSPSVMRRAASVGVPLRLGRRSVITFVITPRRTDILRATTRGHGRNDDCVTDLRQQGTGRTPVDPPPTGGVTPAARSSPEDRGFESRPRHQETSRSDAARRSQVEGLLRAQLAIRFTPAVRWGAYSASRNDSGDSHSRSMDVSFNSTRISPSRWKRPRSGQTSHRLVLGLLRRVGPSRSGTTPW